MERSEITYDRETGMFTALVNDFRVWGETPGVCEEEMNRVVYDMLGEQVNHEEDTEARLCSVCRDGWVNAGACDACGKVAV